MHNTALLTLATLDGNLCCAQVFDNPARMTEVKAQRLKESMKGEFGAVFELCQCVSSSSRMIVVGVVVTMLMIVIIATVLGLGISWSHIKKKITGQFDTDDVGE